MQFPPSALQRLQEPEFLVVCDTGGEVAGMVCMGVRPADGAGLIVQLHGWGNFTSAGCCSGSQSQSTSATTTA
ncbi:hypothetical protein [Streptomyces sp. NPDC007355]|uniref:hypothetical protein n=1 Tax=Streptomyces sp. NPDC007355 TaxID=3364778 RepID=UPI0036AAEFB0